MKPEPDKLVFISLTNGAGGAEQVLHMISQLNQSPFLFLKKENKSSLKIDDEGQNIKYLNNKSIFLGFLTLLRELYRYRKRYTIISSHSYLNAYLGFLKRIGYLKSNLVVRESTSIFNRYKGIKRFTYRLAYKIGYPAVSLIVCQTNEMREQLIKSNHFLPAERVIVLDNPIDVSLVTEKSNSQIDDPILSTDYICTAGRLMPIKGFEGLIKAFKIISDKYNSLNLIILGEGNDRQSLTELLNNLGLTERVILKGFVDNPFPYFKKAKLCVVSSIKEGFPNVLLQMMALNNSVVSTLCADGIKEIESIHTVPVNDIEKLAFALDFELAGKGKSAVEYNFSFFRERNPQTFLNSILTKIR
jgi:glycosyltransferase involved in cell wall biosynthesis